MGTTAEGQLVKSARERVALSQRALARRAGVPATTVIRIERGDVEPTTRTLRTLLAAAGQELRLEAIPAPIPQLAALSNAWTRSQGGVTEPDWTRLRAFVDVLSQHPEWRGPSTLSPPAPSGSELLDNLLAAIAEKVSEDADLGCPSWTRRVPPLKERWEPDGTPRMLAHERAATPRQFADRRITLAEENLWRHKASSRG